MTTENNDYYDYTKMMNDVENLKSNYDCLDIGYIGDSILGNSLPVISIGRGQKSVIFIGSHHGMEWISSALLMRFIFDYCEGLKKNAQNIFGISYRILFETRNIIIVPMLNPDGVGYSLHGVQKSNPLYNRLIKMNSGSSDFSSWQANARGVDLNHNYNCGFEKYKIIESSQGITNGAPSKYSGEHPESEPEIKALCNLVRIKEPYLALSLHTQGEEIYYTSGGNSSSDSLAIAKTISRLSGYAISMPIGTAQYGGFTDWFIEEFKRPSFTLECGKGTNPLPFSDLDEIYCRIKRVLFTAPILI